MVDRSLLPAALSILLLSLHRASFALPLSTNSRWIVDDQTGNRVKLACVNWASHLDAAVAEGLDKQPLDNISRLISTMGFNCVRLTWPLFLFTDDSYSNLTVRSSFESLNLIDSVAALQFHNPHLIDLPLTDAFKAVVSSLAANSIFVILDNHISKPGWCCSNSDGNGFFNDQYFDPSTWISGLARVASRFNDTPQVVGMSLRNELRGPKQNQQQWFQYMQKGAEAVHSANPRVLVILSGLSFDTDLSFVRNSGGGTSVKLSFPNKLVFELHWYGFSDGQAWVNGNPNQVCGSVVSSFMRRGGFLLTGANANGGGSEAGEGGEEYYPLFLSEFGVDQRGVNVNDNRYLNCVLGVMAEMDMDWALWTLQGSYYLREGKIDLDETYGLLNQNWSTPRNGSLLARISVLQFPFQGPGLSQESSYQLIFHPLTGLCITRQSTLLEPLKLGPCTDSGAAWTYTTDHTLQMKERPVCVAAIGQGKAVKLGNFCSDANSRWNPISASNLHLASNSSDDSLIYCMDVDSNQNVVTNPCECLEGDKKCDPASQWFKIVSTTRDPAAARHKF
ncbi:Major extracellular endoglucanase [Nymphaea thermarum]|nr:Major extracellular endoglucanase [Nymphaea thermarum]